MNAPRRPASGLRPSVRPDASSAGSLPGSPLSLAPNGVVHVPSKIGTVRRCTRDEGAAILSQALRNTMGVVGATVTDVAYWCDTDRRTVQRWLSGDATVAVECVVRSSRLWATFSLQVDQLREEAGLVRRVG